MLGTVTDAVTADLPCVWYASTYVKKFQQISGSFSICSIPLSSSLHCLVLIKRKLEKAGVSLLAMQWVVRENLSVPSASVPLYVFSCRPVGVLYFCIIKLTSAL